MNEILTWTVQKAVEAFLLYEEFLSSQRHRVKGQVLKTNLQYRTAVEHDQSMIVEEKTAMN
jgi:hypothetical protein